MKKRQIQTRAIVEKHIDSIKDEIDTLHEIRSPKRRLAAARDLIDYITLHHIEYPS
jgi:cell fate (sporulation/competence/biofilm development) regulator YmcA (YheA/YmcA/DUF963 family)